MRAKRLAVYIVPRLKLQGPGKSYDHALSLLIARNGTDVQLLVTNGVKKSQVSYSTKIYCIAVKNRKFQTEIRIV